ncbi:MAG: chromosomal replication initiator protein DnaA [Zetaproteobacteria bacterium]|nr:MAG: chromosomal replication initiator protein DnaA [Zetaproteobacteria bacterium]
MTLGLCCDQGWEELSRELERTSSPSKFDAWVRNISTEYRDGRLTIVIPSRFFLDGFKREFHERIEQLIPKYFPAGTRLDYRVDPSSIPSPAVESGSEKQQMQPQWQSRFRFENFIVGPSNEFCHAASIAVADHPGSRYNPLYIYGGVGLGKTHLITAVANRIHERDPKARIAFLSGELFTNRLLFAIRTRSNEEFRRRYREVDVLIIDDVQFIAGKESTQEEFFHTFDTLHKANKQILLTSDQPPGALRHLEERLRSRFNWGLVADVQPPNMETRIAILYSKAELAGIQISDELCELLASRITSNVRELEGALTRLSAFSSFHQRTIDVALARSLLPDLLSVESRKVTVEQIQEQVADFYNIRTSDLRGKSRRKNIVLPRQIAMFICKEMTTLSLPEIADHFGGRDHTTVLYAVRKISTMRKEDHDFMVETDRIMARIKGQ